MAVTTEPIVKEVRIAARPETVFEFFTDPEKLARWGCREATVDPRPGGVLLQTHGGKDGRLWHMRGEFVEVVHPSRLVMTWGWDEPEGGIAPGASTVEVTLEPDGEATLLRLVHRDIPEGAMGDYDEGWQMHLDRLVAAVG